MHSAVEGSSLDSVLIERVLRCELRIVHHAAVVRVVAAANNGAEAGHASLSEDCVAPLIRATVPHSTQDECCEASETAHP